MCAPPSWSAARPPPPSHGQRLDRCRPRLARRRNCCRLPVLASGSTAAALASPRGATAAAFVSARGLTPATAASASASMTAATISPSAGAPWVHGHGRGEKRGSISASARTRPRLPLHTSTIALALAPGRRPSPWIPRLRSIRRPCPGSADQEAKGSSNATSHAPSHTLRPHGYMGVEGESSEAAS